MKIELERDGEKKVVSVSPAFWAALMIIGVCSGYVIGELEGAASGAVIAVLFSLLMYLGLVPFAGIPLFIWASSWMHDALGELVSAAGDLTFTLLFYVALIPVVFMNVVISAIVALFILAIVKG